MSSATDRLSVRARISASIALLVLAIPARAIQLDNVRLLLVGQSQAGNIDEAGDRFGSAVAIGDFDGDGWDDLAAGAPGESLSTFAVTGAVFVYPGSGGGGIGAGSAHTESSVGLALGADDQLGTALVAGDFDGDGYDDLVASAPYRAGGMIFVWPGSATGVDDATVLPFTSDQLGCGTPVANDRFGAAFAAGDLNGDGFDDLAIGAPGVASNAGAVCVVAGSANGLVAGAGAEYFENTNGYVAASVEAGDSFGAALAIGHFDGDAYLDLAIGAPGEAPGANPAGGSIQVFFGKAGSDVANFFASGVPFDESSFAGGSIVAGDLFGSTLAAGDVDGDGIDDLVVDALGPPTSFAAGAGFLILGGASSLSAHAIFDESDLLLPTPQTAYPGEKFGYSLALADLDGDRHADLIAGAPGEITSLGVIAIMPGSDDLRSGTWYKPDDIFGKPTGIGEYFGNAVASGNFLGNATPAVVIGAPGDFFTPGVTSGSVWIVATVPEPSNAALAGGVLASFAALACRVRRRDEAGRDA